MQEQGRHSSSNLAKIIVGLGLVFLVCKLFRNGRSQALGETVDAAETNQRENASVLEGKEPFDEDTFYTEWVRELIKDRLPFTNEILRRLVVLNGTLLGGSIAFLNPGVVEIDPGLKNAAVILFFLSLVVSFYGMMPQRTGLTLEDLGETERKLDEVFDKKMRILWLSGGLLGLGFIAAFAGLVTA